MTEELLPCPFCGGKPNIEPWHGGKPTKMMISCPGVYANSIMGHGEEVTCETAPMVTGETKKEAIKNWNTRAQPKYKRVGLEEFICDFVDEYRVEDFRAKYGDLYVLTKEGE